MYEVLIIKATGEIVRTVQPKAPTYEQQSDAVGGYIETIPYFTKIKLAFGVNNVIDLTRGIAYCNENGFAEGKPFNATASAMWRESCPKGDPDRMNLRGDVIFFAKQPKEKSNV